MSKRDRKPQDLGRNIKRSLRAERSCQKKNTQDEKNGSCPKGCVEDSRVQPTIPTQVQASAQGQRKGRGCKTWPIV
ncbi:hypothetical protein GOBAR_AA16250 [Gossypium barbadense]|uniref:Uncharacterized protein n=1 Tax=Gossypium barbadense TaxID=3634 RepID=A0A2P5XM36_GOSBA|nr:hypothetical protein GOBAR_AA16250 [Gossypium barbadense]